MTERKVQVRFSYSDDIKLLLEVAAVNPFANKGKWGEVAEKVNAAVSSPFVNLPALHIKSDQYTKISSQSKD